MFSVIIGVDPRYPATAAIAHDVIVRLAARRAGPHVLSLYSSRLTAAIIPAQPALDTNEVDAPRSTKDDAASTS